VNNQGPKFEILPIIGFSEKRKEEKRKRVEVRACRVSSVEKKKRKE